jgi:subtilisin family serine protease
VRAFTRPMIALATACCLVGAIAGPVSARAPQAESPVHGVRSVGFQGTSGGRTFVDGEVLAKFRSAAGERRATARLRARSAGSIASSGWRLLKLPKDEAVGDALATLHGDPDVVDATADHVYHSLAIPNDSLFGAQWGLRNTGQKILGTDGTAGADIDAVNAWDQSTGSGSVIVAVVDSGVATDHPDLVPNLVSGHNFIFNSSNIYDQEGHGTHVSGIIGAAANDGFGVSGVAQHVKIMPLLVLDSTGSGSTFDIANAFSYAASHGAKVVNASLGGSDFDQALLDAVNGAPNTLFVVAAGNDGWNNDVSGQSTYPCDFTSANLLCVAATDQNDSLASFSSYGSISVDLAAPGVNIASTYLPDPGGYNSAHSLADSPAGGYAANTDSWAQYSTAIDPGGSSNCQLHYRLRGDIAPGDTVTAETSPNGSTSWTPLSTFGPNDSTLGSFLAPNPSVGPAPFYLRFHLLSDGSETDDGVYIDNVSVDCSSPTSHPLPTQTFESGLTGWSTGGVGDAWGQATKAWSWVYMDGTSMATPFVSGAAALLWAFEPSSSVAHVRSTLLSSVDHLAGLSGKTVSGGRLNANLALQNVGDFSIPTGVAITGAAFSSWFQTAQNFTVGWTATDTGTGVASYDVRYQRAKYSGAFEPWKTWKSATTSTSATFTASPGYAYCFQVLARDHDGNHSLWSKSKCTALPVNDTGLAAGSGWVRHTSPATYLGTYTSSSTKYATLTLTNVIAKRVQLVVTTCSGCGKVQVFFGSTYYATFSLASSTTKNKQLITVRVFPYVTSPTTISIRVISSGAPVKIEGLGITRV